MSAFLAVYVLGMNPRALPNHAFFGLMLTFVWWDACEAVARAMPVGAPAASVYPWVQGVWVGISAVPAALIHLAVVYPETRTWYRRWFVPVFYAPLAGWVYLIFGTNALIAGVAQGPFGPSARIGADYLLLALLYAAWFYVGVALFVQEWWRVRGSSLRQMEDVVVLGLLLGSIPAGITEIFWPFLSTLDTQLGLSSVYTLVWSVFLAFAIARFRYLVIQPVTEPTPTAKAAHPLERGQNYLVVEEGRAAGMGAFREIVSTAPGLCVSGLAPSRVAERFGLERTPVVWVTTVTAQGKTVRPQGLEFELIHTILKFLRENPGTAVLLDDLDYLAAVDGFEAVARFVQRVANQASAAGGTLIVSVGRDTLRAEQLAILEGSVDRVLEVHEVADRLPSPAKDHALLFLSHSEVPGILALLEASRGLVVTTEHPAKARARYGEAFDVLWVTEHPEPGLACARPTALDTEGRKAMSSYLAAHPGSAIVLVGLEQLALFVDFRVLLAFVKDALDFAALHRARVIATASPNGLPPDETAMIARRFDAPPGPAIPRGSPTGALSTAVPGNRTPNRGRAS